MNNNLLLLATAGFLLLAPAAHILGIQTSSSSSTTMVQDKVKSDEEITKAVKEAILADKDLAKFMNHVTVKSEKGVVTLSGTVDKAIAKSNIEAKAKAVLGVNKVINNIEVKS